MKALEIHRTIYAANGRRESVSRQVPSSAPYEGLFTSGSPETADALSGSGRISGMFPIRLRETQWQCALGEVTTTSQLCGWPFREAIRSARPVLALIPPSHVPATA